MPSPSDTRARRLAPLSKAAFDEVVAQHRTAIASTLAALEAEISRLGPAGALDRAAKLGISGTLSASSRAVTIAAYLGVKDEAELVEAAIAHLRAIGVDHIVACDMGSTDGTWEVLEAYRSSDDFWLVRLDDCASDYFEVWDRTVVEQVKQTGADWAIFLDADEFWIPASGKLKECAVLDGSDLLSVARFNVPLGPAGPMLPDRLVPSRYDELLCLVRPIPNFHAYLMDNPQSPWIEGVPNPKAMARPSRIARLNGWGAHDIVPAGGQPVRRAVPSDLMIAHLPFTTRSRFARKVKNIRRIFAAHEHRFGRDTAWHWRRWLELADKGELDEEFQRTVFTTELIDDLRQQGVIRSAAEWLADHPGFN